MLGILYCTPLPIVHFSSPSERNIEVLSPVMTALAQLSTLSTIPVQPCFRYINEDDTFFPPEKLLLWLLTSSLRTTEGSLWGWCRAIEPLKNKQKQKTQVPKEEGHGELVTIPLMVTKSLMINMLLGYWNLFLMIFVKQLIFIFTRKKLRHGWLCREAAPSCQDIGDKISPQKSKLKACALFLCPPDNI